MGYQRRMYVGMLVYALALAGVGLLLGEPEDISDVVLFLASDMSRYMTGCCLNVNGGLFMQ